MLDGAGGEGEVVLNCFKTHGTLNDSNRSSLAKIIINNETARDFNKRYQSSLLFPHFFTRLVFCMSELFLVVASIFEIVSTGENFIFNHLIFFGDAFVSVSQQSEQNFLLQR